MKVSAFFALMSAAASRAQGEGLSVRDLTMISECLKNWDAAGRPTIGTLAQAKEIAWRVFEYDQLRLARRDKPLLDEIDALQRDIDALLGPKDVVGPSTCD